LQTSFLHALLNELPPEKGSISVTGRTSYAAQEPWIFSGNLRQNILFGQPFDSERYFRTIRTCALKDDLNQFPHGDMTIVGERGVSLSGGQKARVNLARAVYRQANIYIFDDPLSAVDPKVSRQLMDNCVLGSQLAGSLKILVTHQLQYLPQADYIVVLNQVSPTLHGSVFLSLLRKKETSFENRIHL
jgi:ATP-binding cassette subfamily C (CFTR/MRP) protein 4